RHGVTKVTDFGIAKAFGKSSQETRTGVLKGKIAYMPPEQLGNTRPVDLRSDIFSLAVSLYQMTTGVHPFHADTLGETVARVLGNSLEPPSRVVSWRYPPELEAVLMRALSPAMEARFPTAEAFGEALDAVARHGVGLASARDVAQLLESTAGTSVRKRSDALRQALEMAKVRADQSVVIGALPAVPPGMLSGPAAAGSGSVPSGSLPAAPPSATSGPVAPVDLSSKVSFHRSLVVALPPAPGRRRLWVAAACVAVLAPAFGTAAAHLWGGPESPNRPLLPATQGRANATTSAALGADLARPSPPGPDAAVERPAPPAASSAARDASAAGAKEGGGKDGGKDAGAKDGGGKDATKPAAPKAPPSPPPATTPRRSGRENGGAVPVRDPGF
ncbi:MAG TPA: protein kinase, partial [Polyangiaceae bacterium]|nr:protein kinase [Polyangiaceae bacterium]